MFSMTSRIADNGVHDGYATIPLVKNGRVQAAAAPHLEHLTGPIAWAVISRLEPGGYLLPHRDRGPWYHRTHIPLEPAGWYWDEIQGAVQFAEPGVEYKVNHHLAHAVWNDTTRTRVHLVIDRGEPHGTGSFALYPTADCTELVTFLNREIASR